MVRIRPLPLLLALSLGLASTASLAATDMTTTKPSAEQGNGEHPKGDTAGDGSSVNSPGGKDNDSSDTGTDSDAADGSTTGGASSTDSNSDDDDDGY